MSVDEQMTLVVLDPIGLPPYASRGIQQTLTPIQQAAQMRRTVNGALADVSAPQFRKYASNLTCTDQQAPPWDGLWQGMVLVVDCVVELSYKEGGSPGREVVVQREENGFVFYRPRLTMRVMNFSVQLNEWDAVVGWSLDLEEV